MFQSQSCHFGFLNATEKAEAETASDVGNWRDQEIDRRPFEMPIRLKAGQLSYICFDWSLSPVSSVELLDQAKHHIVASTSLGVRPVDLSNSPWEHGMEPRTKWNGQRSFNAREIYPTSKRK